MGYLERRPTIDMKKLKREDRMCLNKLCKKYFECTINSQRKYCSVQCAGTHDQTGTKNPFYGKKHTEEYKKFMSNVQKNKTISEETREKMRKNNSGCGNPMYGRPSTKENITRLIQYNTTRVFSKELLQKMSEGQKKLWQNNDYVRKMIGIFHNSPNKVECQLMNFLEDILPGEYQFVGNGGFALAGKCPDFINRCGKNKIIELFGDYWHGKTRTGKEKIEVEQERFDLFKTHGYQTLIVWQHELKNLDKLKLKIVTFNNDVMED
jgi:hypothetical protein